MTYSGNQLIKVEDAGVNVSLSASMDFKDKSHTSKEYYYDRNGRLAKDLNKGIDTISYNLLNLPRSLTISASSNSVTNTYMYAADGRKLKTNISGKKTDYCGNVIYENNTLKSILIDGGYIEGGKYYFYLTDHLGNNRVVANESGTIVQSNHYYPYGMSFTEGTQTSSQPYKFGGKELDTQKGLNWYDFEKRQMDPVIGRFPTPDPLAEKYYSVSPYVYCDNNPMNRIDPDGRDSYLLIWFSKDNETGHAGIAVDNYKLQKVMDSKGKPVLDSKGNYTYEMVKDGTMTYYDLWPNDEVGMSELQSNVKSDYSKGIKINSISDLMRKDPTGSRSGNVSAEGRAADGIVQIDTDYDQDKGYASGTANSGKMYNASEFNCSTFAENALKKAFPALDASQFVKVPFSLRLLYKNTRVVAPNNLYNAAMKLPGATNISGPKSVVAKPYLEYYGK